MFQAQFGLKCYIYIPTGVFERAFDYFRTTAPELKEERAMLLEEWFNMESSFGNLGDVSIVQKKLPRKVKRKRAMQSEDGNPAGYFLVSFLLTCLHVSKFAFATCHLDQQIFIHFI